MSIDNNDQETQTLTKDEIAKLIEEEVSGLKKKNEELIAKNKSLKTQNDSLNEQISGLDIDEAKRLIEQNKKDEEQRLINEGKANEVFEKKTQYLKDDYEKKLAAVNQELSKYKEQAGKYKESVIGGHISQIAVQNGVIPEGVSDIVNRSRGVFGLTEDCNVVGMDSEGNVIMGKDGVTPLSVNEWVTSLRESAPHLFKSASGTNATSQHGGKQAPILYRDLMSVKEKVDYQSTYGRDAFLKLPLSKGN